MLPVTVIGGYLGAGKTTLVNHALRHANGKRLAVLVNEFGALPIDEDLIEAQDDNIIAIAGGCVCCSYGNDLVQALMDLQQLDPPPDHVMLEASGVALPGAIAASVSLLEGYHLDGIVVLVDAETIRARAEDPYMGDTIMRQLTDADILLLNKSDLVPKEVLGTVSEWLGAQSSGATVVPTCHGAVPNTVILQDFAPDIAKFANGAFHQASQFDSQVLEVSHDCDADTLAAALADPAFNLIRAKGFVPTPDGMRTIQNVARRWSVAHAPDGARPGIVVIAHKGRLDMERLRSVVLKSRTG